MTIIRIPTEDVQTTSRAVKRYVRAVSKQRALTALMATHGAEMRAAHRALTGGQLAEARRLMGDQLAAKLDETRAPREVAR